jgi:hypothetical protein
LALTEQLAEVNTVISTKLHLSDLTEQLDRLVVDRHDPEQEAYQRAKRPALYEQQPKPVSRETLADVLRRLTESDFGTGAINPDTAAAVLLSRFHITARPVAGLVSSPDGDSR